jgi:anti-sigma factor RsiW
MDCKDIDELMADYLGEELAADERRELEAHLDRCEQCRSDVAELRATLAHLESLETVSRESAAIHTRSLRVVRRRRPAVRVALGLSKIAAVLAIGVALGRWTASAAPQDTSPSRAEAPPMALSAPATEIHPEWINLAQKDRAVRSSFANQLTVLAKTRAHDSAG